MADREFIAAKDLPVTEAEEVNVLCVDPATGELAQKSVSGFGGGGQTHVVEFTIVHNEDDGSIRGIGYTWEELLSLLSNPEIVVHVWVKRIHKINNVTNSFSMYNVFLIEFNDGEDDRIQFTDTDNLQYMWFSDGTWDTYSD